METIIHRVLAVHTAHDYNGRVQELNIQFSEMFSIRPEQ
jgi:hypothetical protein